MEQEMLAISLLSEYAYCPRNFIYRYYQFQPMADQNPYIAEGRFIHSRSDSVGSFSDRLGHRVLSKYFVYSAKLGIFGVVDRIKLEENCKTVHIVEEKRGRIRQNKQIEFQLALELYCAQEMFPDSIVSGSIYFFDSRRHIRPHFDPVQVEEFVFDIRERLKSSSDQFEPVMDSRCRGCMYSLICGAR